MDEFNKKKKKKKERGVEINWGKKGEWNVAAYYQDPETPWHLHTNSIRLRIACILNGTISFNLNHKSMSIME